MTDPVEDYLGKLKDELSGADSATVQDALADAEDHLRTGLAQLLNTNPDIPENDALQQVADAYGTPTEVASAYRQIEARVLPPLAPPQQRDKRSWASRFFGVFVDPRAYASLFYMFFSLTTGVVYFTWAVTGLSLSAGLFVLIIGLPFFALFLLSVQGIALVEGRIVEALLGVRMPRRPIFSQKHLGLWQRFKVLVSDKRTWTTILYMILQLPLGVIYFTVFVTMLAFGLVGIAEPVLQFGFGVPFAQFNDFAFHLPAVLMPFVVVVGVLWILLIMHLAKFLGRVHGAYAKTLLVRDP
jgi:hypothetical protein